MVSRSLFRLRAFLPALVLVFVLGNLAPNTALAISRYKYVERTEGDPGDGVLNPVVDPGTEDQPPTVDPTPTALQTSPSLVSGLELMILPMGGGRLVILVPTDWLHLTNIFDPVDGRVHYAP